MQAALHLDAPIQFAAANLPLFDKNLGWLLPAVIGFAIGMIFGLYPANKAAKMKPIDALHYGG